MKVVKMKLQELKQNQNLQVLLINEKMSLKGGQSEDGGIKPIRGTDTAE